ncbi:hypothetical protein SAY87_027319 [Trapa incisa]|uniref:Calmodulin-binding domain-containing protein n=1 Tax=Trapa incisa TaxID=236973 RepID=A0AAN7GN70_9MYRT|nr:hypothetical protein SAY87_027319 [Trapa incisa]
MPLDTSKFVYIGEEEEEGGAAIRTEELASVHEKVEGNLESLGEPKDTLTDSREVPTLESLGERAGAFSGSSEEPNSNVPCKNNVDKYMESPGESEVDSTSNDSYKSAFRGKKFNGLWYLIYQHMVSDLDENGGMESTVERDNKEERKINAKLSPEFDHNPRVEKVEEEAPQLEGLRQSDAIKLLQEAITKILEKSQDQLLIRKSASNYAIFVKKEVDDLSTDWERREDAELKEKMVEAHLVPKAEDQRGVNAECRPNHLASQRWSNLKKYILMRRFIKAMEKTKNLGRRIHGYPSSEVSPEHEKVNLRQQLVGERSAEEWMLDYALQKAVSTLDPAQKRRVALLVEAFERVNPNPAGKTLNNMNASSPSTVGPLASRKTSLVETEERTAIESVSYHELNIEEMPSPSNKCTKAREKLEPSKECDGSLKEIDKFVAGNASDGAVWSSAAVEVMGTVEEVGEAVAKKEENLHSPLPEKGRPISVTDVGEELQLEKKKYTGLWFLIYKQMASGLAAEQGNESTDSFVSGSRKEEEEEAENEKKSIENDNDSLDALESEQSMLTSQREDTEEMNLGKIEAVKLVQKAIDNILGECEDSSPNNLCSTGNEVPEQESKEENCTSCVETSLPPSTDSTKDPYIHKEHKLQSDPERHWPDGAAQQEERKALQDANKSKLRPMRNWNNLRMVILLRRFVKALETKVSNFNPRGGRHLPPDHDAEPEKVNLKHQDMDERKSAEEYLLDYALSRFQAHPCKEKEGPLTRGGF